MQTVFAGTKAEHTWPLADVTDQPYPEMIAAAKLTNDRLLAVLSGKVPPIDRQPLASEAGTPA